MFDFDRSGKTASLAEGLMNESETLKPVHVSFLFLFLCLNVFDCLGFL